MNTIDIRKLDMTLLLVFQEVMQHRKLTVAFRAVRQHGTGIGSGQRLRLFDLDMRHDVVLVFATALCQKS